MVDISVTESDATAIVEDFGGTLHACLTRRVMEDQGPNLRRGSVLYLRQVSMFSVEGIKYLNIIPDCVVALWSPSTPVEATSYNAYIYK